MASLFGPNNAGQNFGMALAWTLWWPLLPLSFLFLGRFWCAICPFTWITDGVQKTVGVQLPAPPRLRRYGVWLIGGLFLLVSYLDEAWRFDSDARKTGCLLLAILGAVVFFAAFFERRTFCRYFCFIGAFAANYSRAGVLELRAAADRCGDCPTQGCYRGTTGASGCPVSLFAPSVDDSSTCTLCANCVKNCPREAIRITIRRPAAELWNIHQPRLSDALLALIMAGVVLLEQSAAAGGAALPVDPLASTWLAYAAVFAMFVAAPILGLASASLGSAILSRDISIASWKRDFSLFGYAVIPLALAGHAAYAIDRLLSWSRMVPFALAATIGCFPENNHPAWLPRQAVLWIELAVLVSGGAAALYTGYRLARRRGHGSVWAAYAPHALLLLSLLAANLQVIIGLMRQR